jgi:hypothetical protein
MIVKLSAAVAPQQPPCQFFTTVIFDIINPRGVYKEYYSIRVPEFVEFLPIDEGCNGVGN